MKLPGWRKRRAKRLHAKSLRVSQRHVDEAASKKRTAISKAAMFRTRCPIQSGECRASCIHFKETRMSWYIFMHDEYLIDGEVSCKLWRKS